MFNSWWIALLDELLDTHHNAESPLRIGKHSISYQVGFSLADEKVVSSRRGTVLLTGGGMCEGGPVVGHLKVCLSDYPRPVRFLVTGYMPRDTLGARVVEAISAREDKNGRNNKSLEVDGITIPVGDIKAEISNLQGYYSGHADQEGLLDFVFGVAGASASTPVSVVA